ncbi:MAG: RagB/SusD family nutrient uptake outer membrane protein, partial [Bacteroidetes bacterium]
VLDQAGFLVPESNELVSYSMEDFQNSDELVEAIVKERRVELAFEGNYLHDLKRLRRAVLNYGTIYPFDSPDLVLPLPQREIDANPALEQNP